MKYAHILHAFYGEPWHLLPDHWQRYHQILQRAMSGQEVTAPPRRESLAHQLDLPDDPSQSLARNIGDIVGPLDPDTGRPLVEQMVGFGPVAIIPVHGPLGRRLNLLDLLCGGCDYLHLAEFSQRALEDPETKVVVFDVDSPGGQGAGLAECCAAIDQLEAVKPTLAFIGGTGASAAYGLSSRCGQILASPGARVGSIGTLICGEDDSAAWAMQGRKLELFASGPLKATGIDGKAWTDQDRAYLQERMLQADAAFKSGIRAARPQIAPEAYSGAWFFASKDPSAPGADGLGMGLIDELAKDLPQVVAALANVA